MDNSTATSPFSKLKGDRYRAYEELPFEVRRALQEALVDWCPLRAREWHQRLLRERRLRPAQATSFLVQTIRRHDHAEVAAFAKTWPKGAEAYPHLAAEATLQRYVGTEGIPAAEPTPPAPPPPAVKQVTVRQGSGKKAKLTAKPSKPPGKRSKVQAKRKAGRRARR
jgi:hypothetical protein